MVKTHRTNRDAQDERISNSDNEEDSLALTSRRDRLKQSPNLLEDQSDENDNDNPMIANGETSQTRIRHSFGEDVVEDDEESSIQSDASPATQTLQQLSQQQELTNLVLSYDGMSQMEMNAAHVLATAASRVQKQEHLDAFKNSNNITHQKLRNDRDKQSDKSARFVDRLPAKKDTTKKWDDQAKAVPSSKSRQNEPPKSVKSKRQENLHNDRRSKSKKSEALQEIEAVDEIDVNDVVCHNGYVTHSGNIQFYGMVRHRKGEYRRAKSGVKKNIAREIVRDVRSQDPPGRFLKRDDDVSAPWYDIGDDKAFAKTIKLLGRSDDRVLYRVAKAAAAAKASLRTNEDTNVASSLLQSKLKSKPKPAPSIPLSLSLLTTIEDFEIYKISIKSEGPLGLTIEKQSTFPMPLIRYFQKTDSKITTGSEVWCRVEGLKDHSAGKQYGIMVGDWFLDRDLAGRTDESTIKFKPISFQRIKQLACATPRPIEFTVARQVILGTASADRLGKKGNNENEKPRTEPTHTKREGINSKSKASADSAQMLLRKNGSRSQNRVRAAAEPQKQKASTQRSIPAKDYKKPQSKDNDIVVPFCVKCNRPDKGRALHHPWCPKNPQFKNSGADEILRRLEYGRKVNCKRCISDYETGRSSEDHLEHNDLCNSHQKTEKQKKKATSRQRNSENKAKAKQSRAATAVRNNHRVAEKSRQKRSVETGNLARETTSGINTAAKRNQNTDKKKISRTNRENDDNSSIEESSFEELEDFGNSTSVMEQEGLTLSWVTCDNPWGPDGVVDGDVVLYAPFGGIGDPETMFPFSNRFAPCPFESSSRYNTTHCTPAEGLQALVLKRDVMCVRPWGFTVYCHEFGGACLVARVDPSGPASAAEFIGQKGHHPDAGLRPNDMIIAVNGKQTGGMSEDCLQIELAAADQDLLLLVSRYKFPSAIQSKEKQQESESIRDIDASMNDERLLHWTQVGISARAVYAHHPLECPNTNEETQDTRLARAITPVAGNRSGLGGQSIIKDQVPMSNETQSPSAEKRACMDLSNLEELRSEPVSASNQTVDDDPHGSVSNVIGHAKNPDLDSKTKISYRSDMRASTKNPLPKERPDHSDFDGTDTSVGIVVDSGASHNDSTTDNIDQQRNDDDNESKSISSGSGSENSNDQSSDIETEDEDDGCAWMGCVCGKIHRKCPVFWLQCDRCRSWYNAARRCIGFDRKEAETLSGWLCPACGEDNSAASSQSLQDADVAEKEDPAEDLATAMVQTEGDRANTETPKDEKNEDGSGGGDDVQEEDQDHPFGKGTLVYIREHAWSRVNNPEGVAEILRSYVDGDGEVVYDIKYVVGRDKRTGVLAAYVQQYFF